MPRAYSVDLRERVLRAKAAGLAAPEIERTLGISRRTVARWQQRLTQGTSLVPGQSPGRPPTIGPEQAAALQAQVASYPDATLQAHCAIWAREQGTTVSVATMSRAIRRLAITVKKSPLRG